MTPTSRARPSPARRRRRLARAAGGRAATALGAALGWMLGAAGAQACSVALVLAIDVSSSVDSYEYQLQSSGMASAFRDPQVVDAIVGGGGAMVSVVFWSGYPHQETRADWTLLQTEDEVASFAAELDGMGRTYAQFPTALGRAMQYIETIWSPETELCGRRVVDISGDGVNNSGPPTTSARRRLTERGITVNALVIEGEWPDPVAFYRENVIGGPGSFIEIARGYEDYARAFRKKLLREIQPLSAMELRQWAQTMR